MLFCNYRFNATTSFAAITIMTERDNDCQEVQKRKWLWWSWRMRIRITKIHWRNWTECCHRFIAKGKRHDSDLWNLFASTSGKYLFNDFLSVRFALPFFLPRRYARPGHLLKRMIPTCSTNTDWEGKNCFTKSKLYLPPKWFTANWVSNVLEGVSRLDNGIRTPRLVIDTMVKKYTTKRPLEGNCNIVGVNI